MSRLGFLGSRLPYECPDRDEHAERDGKRRRNVAQKPEEHHNYERDNSASGGEKRHTRCRAGKAD